MDDSTEEPSIDPTIGDQTSGDPDQAIEPDEDENSDENSDESTEETGEQVHGKRVSLVGRFGGMNQREAANVLRSFGATVVDLDSESSDWVVIGADESPLAEADLLRGSIREAAATGQLEILHETELWQRLGLVDLEFPSRQVYTPAMLAHLLDVSVRVIRRWQRRGLIRPVRTMHRLPYFDFQEVITARRLAQWIASGASPQAIERRLAQWVEVLPVMQRPLDQLSILVEGKQVLLRHGEGLLEPGGQLRFDFGAHDTDTTNHAAKDSLSQDLAEDVSEPSVLSMFDGPTHLDIFSGDNLDEPPPTEPNRWHGHRRSVETDTLLVAAYTAEDDGDYQTAIDCLHAITARDGPRADISFQIGELLYRMGNPVAARERYYMSIELDPDFVEARASLGNVLAETGQSELAVAAFRGALAFHDDYSDVHYNLAVLLDDLDRPLEARHHWNRFLTLSPDSPWAHEAIERLEDGPATE